MSILSLGLKAGLAAGVIYGAMLGVQHFALLEACSTTQLNYIAKKLVAQNSNETATDVFSTDVVIFPIYTALTSLVLGVFYGVAYSYLYPRLPGGTSKRKGVFWSLPVFLLGIFLEISGLEISCSPNWVPVLALAISFPISAGFGYVLGTFYDSFGRLEKEQLEDPGHQLGGDVPPPSTREYFEQELKLSKEIIRSKIGIANFCYEKTQVGGNC